MDRFTISLPVIGEWVTNDGRLDVLKSSPREYREALEQFARYFKQELHFDFMQYEANEHIFSDEPYHGYVFTQPAHDVMTEEHSSMPTRLVGGCCFRMRNYKELSRWELDWIWLHPFVRKKGILSKQWPFFKDKFGEFFVSPPYSLAMEMFLNKSI